MFKASSIFPLITLAYITSPAILSAGVPVLYDPSAINPNWPLLLTIQIIWYYQQTLTDHLSSEQTSEFVKKYNSQDIIL